MSASMFSNTSVIKGHSRTNLSGRTPEPVITFVKLFLLLLLLLFALTFTQRIVVWALTARLNIANVSLRRLTA